MAPDLATGFCVLLWLAVLFLATFVADRLCME